MEDKEYLAPAQEESGDWPTDEEKAEILNEMQDDIDSDPRPSTAADFTVDI